MTSSRRSINIARPRQIAMFLCKGLTSYSYPEIGKAFGGKDHTTVIHAVKKIESMLEIDQKLKKQIFELKEIYFYTYNYTLLSNKFLRCNCLLKQL